MKKILILITAVIIASCSDNLESLNENIKDPSSVPGETLFTGAQKNLVDQMVDLNVNNNNTKLWAQYLQETTYTDESNYDQVTRTIPATHWSVLYKDVLKDLDEASKIITDTKYSLPEDIETKANKLQVIEILTIYAYSVLVETFGNVPYTEALDIEDLLPAYDDGETVYKALIGRLTTAIDALDTSKGSFGAADNIYGGDVSLWKKFAASLKLRMGILLSDVDNAFAKTTVESAVASGVFTSRADNANFTYLSAAPNTNPVHANLVLSGRADFVAAATIVDMMNTLNDPRRPLFFEKTTITIGTITSTTTAGTTTTLNFEDPIDAPIEIGDEAFNGSVSLGTISGISVSSIDIENISETPEVDNAISFSGYKGGTIGSTSSFSTHSHVSDYVEAAATPGVIFDYAEVEFLLAEAAARTFAVGGTAKSHYDIAVVESIESWGGSNADAMTYLAQPTVDYDTALAASTATTPWKEVIGNQKWIALFNRGIEAWTSIRLLDFPILATPAEPVSGFPNRYTYPIIEQTLNGSNWQAASTAIGGDLPETKLFWDLN
ncbi:hypothetical protein ATO12_20055 [Aquimarina atlantica]|uniref:Starch-binding protein n=1 Tax=Aquimarina atlantica TaxID=1317122 RepID=A0A023BTF2_9FLAO|nr:SusD/RagB family nutrient-binding outer membrane lipoprotein [Aquimarina atlantica]EZH73297.1 hypothetical protein ATO12_20055 [Aquimarina atlantica]